MHHCSSMQWIAKDLSRQSSMPPKKRRALSVRSDVTSNVQFFTVKYCEDNNPPRLQAFTIPEGTLCAITYLRGRGYEVY
jgi:hypothetical protein